MRAFMKNKSDSDYPVLFETVGDHQLFGLFQRADWREAIAALREPDVKRLLLLLERARGPVADRIPTPLVPQAKSVVSEYEDRNISVREAAHILGYSPRWVYNNWRKLPFTVKMPSGARRFNLKKLREWQQSNEQRNG
jgi:predicted DNA-binding transcriptional regulator AlpA